MFNKSIATDLKHFFLRLVRCFNVLNLPDGNLSNSMIGSGFAYIVMTRFLNELLYVSVRVQRSSLPRKLEDLVAPFSILRSLENAE